MVYTTAGFHLPYLTLVHQYPVYLQGPVDFVAKYSATWMGKSNECKIHVGA